MRTRSSVIVSLALAFVTTLASAASAAGPVMLSEPQMDRVTAGIVAFAGQVGSARVVGADVVAAAGIQSYTFTQSVTTVAEGGDRGFALPSYWIFGSPYFSPVFRWSLPAP